MATSLRGSATGEREKRGTSPSKPLLKKSPKPSSSSPTNEEKLNEPTETTKPIPNYLKPTMSSRKSSSDTSSSQKPALNRRRSFDRPPPSSQVQRAIRPSSGSRENKTQRSTSFSSKSSSPSVPSTRPASEKLYARTSSLKDKKVEEPRESRSRSVKKSALSSTGARKEPSTSSSSPRKKAPTSVTSESSIDYENASVDHVTTELDDLVNLDYNEVQSLPEMSEMPDGNEDLADPTNIEVEGVKHVEEDPKGGTLEVDNHHDDRLHEDSSTIVDVPVVLEETVVDKETDDRLTLAEESTNDQLKVEAAADQNLAEGTADRNLVGVAADQNLVGVAADQNLVEGAADQQDEAGIEKSVPEAEPAEIVVDEKKEEEKETVTEKEDQEKTDEKQIVSSPPVDAAAAAPANAQSSAGKKDKQAYNDVIEETATKLRGKKGNKVLALAGAFETVISLQDTNNKS